MGDSSDNYPGIERVGKTALKLLHQGLDQLKPSKMKEHYSGQPMPASASHWPALSKDAPLKSPSLIANWDNVTLGVNFMSMDFRRLLAICIKDEEVVASQETTRYPVTWLESIEDDHVKAAGAFYLEISARIITLHQSQRGMDPRRLAPASGQSRLC